MAPRKQAEATSSKAQEEDVRGADDPQGTDTLEIIELDVSLADVEKPELLPKGWYDGEIRNVTIRKSGKGNDYYNLELIIPTTQFPAGFEEENYPDGAAVYYNRLLVPGRDRRSLWNMKQFIEKLDLPVTNRVDPNEWMGRPVKIKIGHNLYQGQTNMNVEAIEALG